MRFSILIALLGVSLSAQDQPCTGFALDYNARCACIKDPNSPLCELVKGGAYGDSHGSRKFAAPAAQPARPRQARVVPLAHKDYLRFLQPNAHLAAGFDFEKALQSPELMEGLFGRVEGEEARNKVIGALKEMDHLWLSFAGTNDLVVLMTGKFEQGAAAGMFYAQGVQPVFLGGARVMMIGPEPSIQGALARLAKPAGNNGWVTQRARELSRDHEMWIVTERPAGTNQDSAAVLRPIRQFALGVRLTGETGVDGEAVADSEASALKIAAWLDQMKGAIHALDSLNIEHEGSALRFAVKGDAMLGGQEEDCIEFRFRRRVVRAHDGGLSRNAAKDRGRRQTARSASGDEARRSPQPCWTTSIGIRDSGPRHAARNLDLPGRVRQTV